MSRPVLFRVLPPRLRELLYYARYCPAPPHFHSLFAAAPLTFAPGVSLELVPTDVGHGCVALAGFVELGLSRRVAKMARETGGLMVDVGANAGYFSALWAAARTDNSVIAFEASPRNVDRLRRNVERNGFGSRVQVEARAAGREAGTLEFDMGPEEQTGWGGLVVGRTGGQADSDSSQGQPTARPPDRPTVEVVRLDDAVPAGQHVALLKIDTEGADTWVLMGAEGLLRGRRVGRIFFEQNKPRLAALGIGEDEAERFLAACGYTARPLDDPGKGLVEWEAWPT